MKPKRAWKLCKSAGADGGTILYDIFIDWETMRRLARKAAKNQSKKSKIGPVQVVVTKIEQLSNNGGLA